MIEFFLCVCWNPGVNWLDFLETRAETGTSLFELDRVCKTHQCFLLGWKLCTPERWSGSANLSGARRILGVSKGKSLQIVGNTEIKIFLSSGEIWKLLLRWNRTFWVFRVKPGSRAGGWRVRRRNGENSPQRLVQTPLSLYRCNLRRVGIGRERPRKPSRWDHNLLLPRWFCKVTSLSLR